MFFDSKNDARWFATTPSTTRRSMLLFIISLFVACSTATFKKPMLGSYEIISDQKTELLKNLTDFSNNSPFSFKISSDSTIKSTDGKFIFRHAFLFEKPDKLRIEAFPLNTGISLSLLVSKDGNAKYIDSEEGIIHEGSAREDFFGRYLKVPLSERDLRYLLIGRIPFEFLESGKLKIYSEGNNAFYDIVYGDFQFYWKVDKKTLVTQEFQVWDIFNGKQILKTSYYEFADVDRFKLPNQLSIEAPSQDLMLDLRYKKIVTNTDINDALFVIPNAP